MVCGSFRTVKNGTRKGVQLYRCKDCGSQFRAGSRVSEEDLWRAYQQDKQTVEGLSRRYKTSVSTVKRMMRGIRREWEQPQLSGGGYVHLDTTYWGRSFGVLLALDSETGKPLYMAFVRNETAKAMLMLSKASKDAGMLCEGL